MSHAWYCARTKPLLEGIAEERLQNQGFTTYLPLLTNRVPYRGRMVERRAPLFRSYLFVQLDMRDPGASWRAVNSTRAIQSLLPRPERPEPIRAHDVEGLADAELQGFFRKGVILPGQRLRVYRGTLVGQVLVCLEQKRDCVVALWTCFNTETRVTLRTADVGVYS